MVAILQSSWGKSTAGFQPHEVHFQNSVHTASRWRKRVTQPEDKGWGGPVTTARHPFRKPFLGHPGSYLQFFFFFPDKKG